MITSAGDRWVFEDRYSKRRTIHSFAGERGDLLIFTEGGRQVSYSADRALFPGGVVSITIIGPMTFPYAGAVAFPLSVGKTWRFSRVVEGRSDKLALQANARVEAWERVPTRGDAAGVGAFSIEIQETQAPPLRLAGVEPRVDGRTRGGR